MINIFPLFISFLVVSVINMVRYFSALRALLQQMQTSDPQLYQSVDGAGFFTARGQPARQVLLVRYLFKKGYRDHQDEAFVRHCVRTRHQFILTSFLCVLTLISLLALLIR